MLRFLVPLSFLLVVVRGHSWLVCTDYLEENGHYYKPEECRAHPRGASFYAPKDLLFGTDTGFNYNPTETQACVVTRNDTKHYPTGYHIAVYYPGQRVVLVHPMKNHGADKECTNVWIPDNSNKIYFSNGNTDPALSVFRKNLLVDLGVSPVGQGADTQTYPKQGYQNAPKFCNGTDKAMGSFAFDFPKMPPGRYTFMWEWEFNQGSFYTSCWEADVVSSKGERDAKLRQSRLSTNEPNNLAGVKVPVSGYGQYKPPSGTQPPSTNGPVVVPNVPSTNGPVVVPNVPSTNSPVVVPSTESPVKPVRPIDGAWGVWKSWGKCSVSCGSGTERRVRFCDSPAPQNGGKTCVGSDEETRPCNSGTCPQTSLSDLKVNVPSRWDTGTNGQIMLPNPKPPGSWKVILKLPCDVQGINVWHGNDVSTAEHRAKGVFALSQSDWMLQKPDIGFTAFYSGSCTLTDIKASIEY